QRRLKSEVHFRSGIFTHNFGHNRKPPNGVDKMICFLIGKMGGQTIILRTFLSSAIKSYNIVVIQKFKHRNKNYLPAVFMLFQKTSLIILKCIKTAQYNN